jgi:hypothetical protein
VVQGEVAPMVLAKVPQMVLHDVDPLVVQGDVHGVQEVAPVVQGEVAQMVLAEVPPMVLHDVDPLVVQGDVHEVDGARAISTPKKYVNVCARKLTPKKKIN